MEALTRRANPRPSPRSRSHFHVEFDADVAAASVTSGVNDGMYVDGVEAVVSFAPDVAELTLRVGTSFISAEQAAIAQSATTLSET